ncbi:hypothetical protein CH256_03865 [Rhodococcus sp. 05-2254-6]|nr:hypothetical protein CH256_03865 [Rhodococcus sp. 05-2254-6]
MDRVRTVAVVHGGGSKQSIYRFRRADIASHMAARDATDTADVVRLTTNFRSTKPVLNWVNSVFGTLVVPSASFSPTTRRSIQLQADRTGQPEQSGVQIHSCSPTQVKHSPMSIC